MMKKFLLVAVLLAMVMVLPSLVMASLVVNSGSNFITGVVASSLYNVLGSSIRMELLLHIPRNYGDQHSKLPDILS